MDERYTLIDQSDWKRKVHCEVFRGSLEPRYSIGFELDVTRFLADIKQRGYSFTLSMIYLTTQCANDITEFRYRFIGDDVVLYDTVHTSFTYLNPQTELFHVVYVPMQSSMRAYLQLAQTTIKNQTEYFTGPLPNNVFQFSPLPWITYTHVSHTIPSDTGQAIPIFDWGKYVVREGRTLLPFSVHVHHSFVDGIHIAKLAQYLQDRLDACDIR